MIDEYYKRIKGRLAGQKHINYVTMYLGHIVYYSLSLSLNQDAAIISMSKYATIRAKIRCYNVPLWLNRYNFLTE